MVGATMAAGKGVAQGKPIDEILKDTVIGGTTGYLGGQMMPADVFGASTAVNSTAGNSLNAGASLMGSTPTAVGSNIGAGTTSLLGSPTNIAPAYDMGMNGVTASQTGFQAGSPLGSGINNSIMQTPDYIGSHLTSDVNKIGLTPEVDTSIRNIDGSFTETPTTPNFSTNNITKSTPEELEAAQGGFEKPLYERAFDSVVGFAEKNPIEMAGLGLTAFGALKEPPKQGPDSSFARSAGVLKQAYSPTVSKMKIRRA